MSPLSNSYLAPTQLNQKESFYPLHVYVCESCFLVQLEEFESPEQIFSDYAYLSSYSDSWLDHVRAYTDMIVERLGLNEQSQVVEIGSNDGYLLQYFMERNIPVLGIEPAANVAEIANGKGVPTLVAFFGQKKALELAAEGKKADLVVGNNVLAHVPTLNDFVKGMKILLKAEGIISIEFPHLMQLMAENQFDTIYHEHFSYFSLLTAQKIFAKHGLTLFDVEEHPTHGGSLRIYARHTEDNSKSVNPRVKALLAKEEATGFSRLEHYLSFSDKVQETKLKLLDFLIRAKKEGKSIAAYGAPAKGNTLLNYCGIRSDVIQYTVDRNPKKQGLFLPGSHIPIYHPEKIKETQPDYLFILPWNLKEEIMEQVRYISSWGGKFIVPIPEVKLYP